MTQSPSRSRVDPRRGAALILVLLVSVAVSAMALGAILMTSAASETTRFTAREAALQAAANGGLEIIRDSLNRGLFDSLLPVAGFTTMASNASVYDAMGAALPRITRSLYVGRTGGRTGGPATAGQYGSNFASAVSIIRDQRGAVAARRLLMTQESWAKFAVAINNWSGNAPYGCGSSVSGPLHSNQTLKIQAGCSSPKTLFSGPVTVVGSIENQSSGNFTAGYKTGVSVMEWPTPARINLMRQYAQDGDATNGDYDLTSRTNGADIPGLRIEFLTIDANGNGTIEWNEGYMRVWHPANTRDSVLAYATARRWPTAPSGTTLSDDHNMISRNCGGRLRLNGTTRWYTAQEIYTGITGAGGSASDARNGVRWVLSRGSEGSRPSQISNSPTPTEQRCFQGGDPMLFSGTAYTDLTPDSLTTNTPLASKNFGWWRRRRGGVHPTVSSRADGARLIPLGANPNFKGVIFVTGDVAISGTLRGRASVFATGNIVLSDDLLYHNAPGTKCDVEGDIFGAIATLNVIVADNNVQTPFRIDGTVIGGYDDTPRDEQYNMFIMAAGNGSQGNGNLVTQGIAVSDFGGSPGPDYSYSLGTTSESCGSNAPAGCARVTGGIATGRMDFAMYRSGVWGYASAHAYDRCGAINPPPYFPTTGRFIESRYYELDPVWLNQKGIANYFAELRAQ